MRATLERLRGLIQDVFVAALADGELDAGLPMVWAVEQELAALRLAMVWDAGCRDLPRRMGAVGTASWVADRLRISSRKASAMVRLAEALHGEASRTGDALSAGEISVEQAVEVVGAVRRLPAGVRADGEVHMLGLAERFAPPQLRMLAARLEDVVDPDGAEGRRREQFARQERRAAECGVTWSRVDGDDGWQIRGRMDAETAAVVRAALDPLCSPRRHRDPLVPTQRTDPDVGEASSRLDHAVAAVGAVGAAGTAVSGLVPGGGLPSGVVGDDRPPMADLRTAAARRLAALKDVCLLSLASGRLPDNGGDRPQVAVTVSWETLRDQVGAATLDDGTEISPADARRLACDCGILPVVLGGGSVPLDVGRERRLFTGPIRRALDIRDRGCCFPGCDRPRQWCSAHHVVHWADGGRTSVANGGLLCDVHHHVVHEGEWVMRINPDDGLPEFIPPASVDPQRRPRRNTYHLRR